jgi:hypothetical protein
MRAAMDCDGVGDGRKVVETRGFCRMQSFKELIDAPSRCEIVIIETFEFELEIWTARAAAQSKFGERQVAKVLLS